MKNAGWTQKSISQELGRSESTISRELSRNRDPSGDYHALRAQRIALDRRTAAGQKRKLDDPELLERVTEKLELNWSPQQISGCFAVDDEKPVISHQTIYQYLDGLPRNHAHRRAMRRKGRRKRKAKPGFINRAARDHVSIHDRPKVVGRRSRLGDWELDLMTCGGTSGYLITAVERLSGYTLIRKVMRKQSGMVIDGIERMFEPISPEHRLTFTFDNGSEFYYANRLRRTLEIDPYFCDPYNSGQRGLNENTNGLIRQYFPKHLHYGLISYWDVQKAQRKLNQRPRMRLDYQTPQAVFENWPKIAFHS